jgi:hypothetical protein
LGLLPAAGRKIIPEMPALITCLDAGRGEFTVTLEPARGSVTGRPRGPVMFRAQTVSGGARASGCVLIASVSGLQRQTRLRPRARPAQPYRAPAPSPARGIATAGS